MVTKRKPQGESTPCVEMRMTLKQAEMIRRACEFYARVRAGQFSEIAMECGSVGHQGVSMSALCEQHDAIYDALYTARALLFPELGNLRGRSWGVGHDANSDMAWDIHTVLRHALYMASLNGRRPELSNVAADDPIQWGKEPLCQVVVCGEIER